jgi:hypothetical protein
MITNNLGLNVCLGQRYIYDDLDSEGLPCIVIYEIIAIKGDLVNHKLLQIIKGINQQDFMIYEANCDLRLLTKDGKFSYSYLVGQDNPQINQI